MLKGKKTYITAALVGVVTALVTAGVITEAQAQAIYGGLAAFGLYALRDGIRSAAPAILAAIGLAFALSAPTSAQAEEPPMFGCGGGTCSIYVLDASWPPAIGVNGVEFVRGRFGADLRGLTALGQLNPIGGVCLIPKVGASLGPVCGALRIGGSTSSDDSW